MSTLGPLLRILGTETGNTRNESHKNVENIHRTTHLVDLYV